MTRLPRDPNFTIFCSKFMRVKPVEKLKYKYNPVLTINITQVV